MIKDTSRFPPLILKFLLDSSRGVFYVEVKVSLGKLVKIAKVYLT